MQTNKTRYQNMSKLLKKIKNAQVADNNGVVVGTVHNVYDNEGQTVIVYKLVNGNDDEANLSWLLWNNYSFTRNGKVLDNMKILAAAV